MKKFAVLVMLLLSLSPVLAQEDPVIRLYFVPIEHVGDYRGPEYFHWRFDDELLAETAGIPWNLMDYGLIDQGIVAADVTVAQHNFLVAQPDVLAVPQDLDAMVTGQQITALNNYLEGINVPTDWLVGGTVREGLRTITAMYQYMQRLTAITNTSPFDIPGISLNAQFSAAALNNYPLFRNMMQGYLQQGLSELEAWTSSSADAVALGASQADIWRMTFLYAAESMGYNISGVTANTTLRIFMKAMSDQWEDRPINFGLMVL